MNEEGIIGFLAERNQFPTGPFACGWREVWLAYPAELINVLVLEVSRI
jgi:hypothetical protein